MSDQPKTVSLQKQLVQSSILSSMVAGLIALALLIGISFYQTMQLHDQMMDEIAEILLSSDISAGQRQAAGADLDELSEQFEIDYQLTLPNQLLTETDDFEGYKNQHETVLFNAEHFAYIWLDGQLLRRYKAIEDDQTLTMYQPMLARFQELAITSLGYLGILGILWLLQWGIVQFAIKRQFRSLLKLSKDISEKNAADLSPIRQPQPELQELQPMVVQINHMLSRLEQSLQAEQRFTSDASHELRSPLSAIQMRLQLLNRKYGEIDPALTQGFRQIQADVTRGNNVLENLLLLARLDPSDATQLPRQSLQMNALVEEVIKILQLYALEKQIHYQLELENVRIEANKELILSCIRNVVDNAIRYSEQGGIIKINLNQHNSSVHFKIENGGQGLSEVVLKRLGERFYRELGTKTQGSGLGLSICKKIIQLHGGKIEFSASNFGGLRVDISLPIYFGSSE